MKIESISRRKFEALIFIREAWLPVHWEEVEWYDGFGKVLAVIAQNRLDKDFCFVVLARDERKVFRLHLLAPKMFGTLDKARSALMITLEPFEYDGKVVYEQSPIKKKEIELFKPIVPEHKQHQFFQLLAKDKYYEGAKNIIEHSAHAFFDVDGNFIKDFQSTEFNNRLWELFLHIYLTKRGFKTDTSKTAPDFCLDFYGYSLCIEAVTVGPNPDFDEPTPKGDLEEFILTRDYMPIKYHNTLTRKLQKNYHLLDHVKGRPLLFAIHDYHVQGGTQSLGSMSWTGQALMDYLYGYRRKCEIKSGEIICEESKMPLEKIGGHFWKGKSVPSGFFYLPESEHISAVMFANNGTLGTFNRMAKLAKMGSEETEIIRRYIQFDANAGLFNLVEANVNHPDYEEDWGDSVAFYHNPRALHPLDSDIFADATHFFFKEDEKQLYGHYAHRYTPSSTSWQLRPPTPKP